MRYTREIERGGTLLAPGRLEPGSHIRPVRNLENGFHVVRTNILVLQVVGMLPYINTKEGHEAGGGLEGVLVGAGGNLQHARRLVVPQPAPPGPLHGDCGGGELVLHGLETAEVPGDGLGQLAAGVPAPAGTQVLPKYGVVEVSSAPCTA